MKNVTAQEYFAQINSIMLIAANDIIRIQLEASKEASESMRGQFQGANLVEQIGRIHHRTNKLIEDRYAQRDKEIERYQQSIPEEMEV